MAKRKNKTYIVAGKEFHSFVPLIDHIAGTTLIFDSYDQAKLCKEEYLKNLEHSIFESIHIFSEVD